LRFDPPVELLKFPRGIELPLDRPPRSGWLNEGALPDELPGIER
jgi:hypothetical protein